jgi:hypothetical protein
VPGAKWIKLPPKTASVMLKQKKLLVQSMLDALDQEDTDHAATLDELLKNSEGNSNFILED